MEDRVDLLASFLLANARNQQSEVEYILDNLREGVEEGGPFTAREIKEAMTIFVSDIADEEDELYEEDEEDDADELDFSSYVDED